VVAREISPNKPSTKSNKQNERNVMNNKFDELTRVWLNRHATRGAEAIRSRLAGMALACFGLAGSARQTRRCKTTSPSAFTIPNAAVILRSVYRSRRPQNRAVL